MPKLDIPAQIRAAVREYVKTADPDAHAEAVKISGWIWYDVMHGPLRPGGEGPDGETMPDDWFFQTYADKLRDLLTGASVPGFYDPDAGCLLTAEPEGYWADEDGEPCDVFDEDADADEDPGRYWVDPMPYYTIESADVMKAYLGERVYRELR